MNNPINQIPYLSIINQPETEPLTLKDVKQALQIDNTKEDANIFSAIKAARIMAEEYLKRSLITQTWQLQYDQYAPSIIALPRGPVQNIVSVKIVSRDWSEITVNDTSYYLNAGKENLVFDAAPMGHIVQIQYITGFGTEADIPENVKRGILQHVVNMFNSPSDKTIPDSAIELYKPHRIVRL